MNEHRVTFVAVSNDSVVASPEFVLHRNDERELEFIEDKDKLVSAVFEDITDVDGFKDAIESLDSDYTEYQDEDERISNKLDDGVVEYFEPYFQFREYDYSEIDGYDGNFSVMNLRKRHYRSKWYFIKNVSDEKVVWVDGEESERSIDPQHVLHVNHNTIV